MKLILAAERSWFAGGVPLAANRSPAATPRSIPITLIDQTAPVIRRQHAAAAMVLADSQPGSGAITSHP
jgi:hypothetical protein